MVKISRLKKDIEYLTTMLDDLKAKMKDRPFDFSVQLEIDSLQNQLSELQGQLYHENLKREKEIIELCFKGESAKFGSLPVEFVGGLTSNFAAAIFNTSKYITHGNKGGKKREKIIRDTIDIRLEGIGKGSTIFYLSGKTSPDLFGDSIIQNSLEKTFELINSEEPEQLSENVGEVGSSSIKFMSRFLKELKEDNLELDLKWASPDDKKYIWDGNREKIENLYSALNQLDISMPEDITFEGELVMISSKGKFEILTKQNRSLFGKFSSDLLEKMKKFHIGDFCQGVITKTTIYNPMSDKEKVEYNLKNIR